MSYTAKDVSSLRQSTGAGMMDCKKALEESGGDIEAAKQWLREKGLAASAKRDDRDNAQGVVSIIIDGARASIVKLKCETDFVASSDSFKAEADALAAAVLEKGEAGLADRTTQIDDLKILLKPFTLRLPVRSTSLKMKYLQMLLQRNAKPSRQSHATKASLSKPLQKLLTVASVVSSKMCVSSSSPMPRTTRSPSSNSLAMRKSFASHR
jgi:hypothetical protein